MTSQKDKIQNLIAEIESTLNRASPILPWVMTSEVNKQRDVLNRTRSYLQALQQVFEAPGGWGPIDPNTGELATATPSASAPDPESSAANVLQALLVEMRYLRENSLKPMRLEIEQLTQQRKALETEIEVLESKRLSASPQPDQQQINAFLETLIERLQANLSTQVATALAKLEADRANELVLQQADVEDLGTGEQPRLHPSERLDQLRLLQSQSDQLLLKLDSTLQTVFESLQKSVESYKDSLADGLDQMHGLGRQGEVIFHALVNHLAQQLGQDASLYLNANLSNEALKQLDLSDQGRSEAEPEDTSTPQDELDQVLEQVIDSLDVELDTPLDEQEVTIIQIDESLALPDLLEDAEATSPITEDNEGLGSGPLTEIQTEIQEDEAPLILESIQDLEAQDLDLLPSGPELDLITETTLAPEDADLTEEFYEDMFGEDTPTPEQLLESDQLLAEADTNFDPARKSDDLLGDIGLALQEPTAAPINLPSDEGANVTADNLILNEKGLDDSTPDLQSSETEIDSLFFDEDLLGESSFQFENTPSAEDLNLEDNLIGLDNSAASEEAADVSVANTDETIDDLFGPVLEGEGFADDALMASPSSDTIESLAELLPDIIGSDSIDPLDAFAQDTSLDATGGFGSSTDSYIPAPADENLLDAEAPANEQRLNLELGEDLVDQLNSDLGQLGDESAVPLSNLAFSETDLQQDSEEALDFDQTTLENLVADLDLTEDAALDADILPSDNLNDLATSLLASDDLDLSPSSSEESGEPITAPASPDVDAFSLEELSQELSLDSFMPDSSELPPLEEDGSTNETEQPQTDAAENPPEDSPETVLPEMFSTLSLGEINNPLLDLDASAEEDLSFDSLTESLGDLETDLIVDPSPDQSEETGEIETDNLLSTADLENLTLEDFLPEVTPADAEINQADETTEAETTEAEITAIMPDIPAPDDTESRDDAIASELNLDLTLDEQSPVIITPFLELEEGDDNDDDLEVGPMLEGLPDELDILSRQADEQAAIGTETGEGLFSDLEEPQLCDGPLPDIPTIEEASPKLDSSIIPDKPWEEIDDNIDISSHQETLESPAEDTIDQFSAEMGSSNSPIALGNTAETQEALDLFDGFDALSPDDNEGSHGDSNTPIESDEVLQTNTPAWYLGVDLGTSGLSAVLLDKTSGQVYPIYWLVSDESSEVTHTEKHFRLPIVAWWNEDGIKSVGYEAWHQIAKHHAEDSSDVLLKQLKPLMKISVPHGQPAPSGEPLLQWSDQTTVSMQWIQKAVEKSLQQLIPDVAHPITCGTIGLEDSALETAISDLKGVIVGYPTNWPDTYSLNLREAVLASGLISDPNQIFFIEDAIATVLSGLPDPQALLADQTTALSRQPSLYNCDWEGGTVVISAGASLTELMLVDLPEHLTTLSYSDFTLRSFPYAGDSLDQDIICQLLYPADSRQTLSQPAPADASQDWHWQASLPDGVAADWASLNLESLSLPQPGEADLRKRHRLQQRLESSPLGQSLIEAARHLKLILQHQSQFQLDLGLQRWLIKRRDLESRIFLPYIQRVNRHLNVLLSQKGFSAQAIKQVICTGGSASLPAIARWLRQKFPNATIIQDTYSGERPNSCSRVAYGLINLVRYPQVLDIHRQQYSDYFLLMELLRVFPTQPLPVSGIMHLLEQRGINTQVCQLHILALLEGHLPPGLVPTESDRPYISDQSGKIVTYQALTEAPLFTKQNGQIYVPNEAQCRRLRAYMEEIMADKIQTLDEPMIAQLAMETVV